MLVVPVSYQNYHKGALRKQLTDILNGGERRKMRLIESYAKCRNLKKLTCKGTLRQMFYLSETPSPPMTSLLHTVYVLSDSYPAFFLLIATTSNKNFLKVQKL